MKDHDKNKQKNITKKKAMLMMNMIMQVKKDVKDVNESKDK